MVQYLKDAIRDLSSSGTFENEELLEILSAKYNLSFIDSSSPIKVIDYSKITEYSKKGYLVFKDANGQICYGINNISYLKDLPANINQMFLVKRDEFWAILEKNFSAISLTKAILHLDFLSPASTAKNINYQKMIAGFLILCAAFMHFLANFFNVINNLVYLAQNLLKVVLFKKSLIYEPEETGFLHPDECPIYTIFVPLYKEVRKVKSIIKAIDDLNYPKSKLDVKFIVEADDFHTIKALTILKLPSHIHIIKVPYSLPRTKPKAMNYAINYAMGEYLTIYDAEDRPDPNQLIKALRAFRSLPNEYACVQARLNFYNAGENLLARSFSIEYKLWFNYLLRGLSLLDLPVTLGGTSNHFKISALHKVGYWDAYNVTEDADLGIRLYLNGYKVHIIDSETLEESPIELGNWILQRARWIKGFIQTFIIFLTAKKDYKIFSPFKVMSVYIFVGFSSYSFFSLPWLIAIGFFKLNSWIYTLWWINSFFAFFYLYGTAIFIISKERGGITKLSLADLGVLLLWPLYFILHSIASYRALWECLVAPFEWNKTRHGVSTQELE
jgi:cellulose synthase/poly-beta-1,6-N-acetylglucosamine synthase-like glycosyltransferase